MGQSQGGLSSSGWTTSDSARSAGPQRRMYSILLEVARMRGGTPSAAASALRCVRCVGLLSDSGGGCRQLGGRGISRKHGTPVRRQKKKKKKKKNYLGLFPLFFFFFLPSIHSSAC